MPRIPQELSTPGVRSNRPGTNRRPDRYSALHVLALENARLVAEADARLAQQRRSLRRLAHSARMASAGLLAGGVSHDINNQLCVIGTHLQLLRLRREGLSPETEESLAAIDASVRRITGKIRALLDYTHNPAGARTLVDMNELIQQFLLLVPYHPVCRKMAVETDLTAGLPPVELNRAMGEQMLLELLINAREAMPAGGAVRIHTRPLLPLSSDLQAEEGERWKAAGGVELWVEDDGPGIPPEHLTRLFDPFFTTKESDRAMGMGFWLCREIVEDHGGEIRVESDGVSGTRVILRLPPARSGAASLPVRLPEPAGRRR